jgi:ferric-dicitrate binding protein FerR (iron transport regulator)
MKAYTEWDIEDFIYDESFNHYAFKSNTHDITKWESIIQTHPEIEQTIKKAVDILTLLSTAKKPEIPDIAKEQQRFDHRILIAEENKLRPSNSLFRGTRKWLAYAAVALVFISIGLSGRFVLEKLHNSKTGVCRIIVAKGQKSVVILPDSTVVSLNSDSELSYSSNFGKENREVSLTGEAYFRVTHDTKHPFLVHARELKIKVYGTEFNLKCYKGDKTIETTLVKGSLSISQKSSKEVFLKPNQQYVYSEKTELKTDIAEKTNINNDKRVESEEQNTSELMPLEQKKVQEVDPYPVTAWKDQKLVFDDDSFSDMVIKIERWYDVKVIIESDKIKQYRYKGSFESETIEQALSALKFATPFNYTINKRTIYIKE